MHAIWQEPERAPLPAVTPTLWSPKQQNHLKARYWHPQRELNSKPPQTVGVGGGAGGDKTGNLIELSKEEDFHPQCLPLPVPSPFTEETDSLSPARSRRTAARAKLGSVGALPLLVSRSLS